MIPGPFEMDEVAEKTMDYSLAPRSIKPFLSDEAYVKEGPNAWKPVEGDWIKKLADQSKKRVAKNDEFKKIADELKKAKARGKWIKLSEIINDKDAKEKKEKARAAKNATKEDKLKEYLKRPDLQEAEDVLTDLMAIESGKPLAAK
jgi:carboxyl-terminal processing protease